MSHFPHLVCQEMLVSAGDMGRDYEHCLELQRKITDDQGVSKSDLICTESLHIATPLFPLY